MSSPRKTTDDDDYYERLRIKPDASAKEIKLAYRTRALETHPDKHDDEHKAAAQLDFLAVKQAYEVLSDPAKRKVYDKNRGATQAATPATPAAEVKPEDLLRKQQNGVNASLKDLVINKNDTVHPVNQSKAEFWLRNADSDYVIRQGQSKPRFIIVEHLNDNGRLHSNAFLCKIKGDTVNFVPDPNNIDRLPFVDLIQKIRADKILARNADINLEVRMVMEQALRNHAAKDQLISSLKTSMQHESNSPFIQEAIHAMSQNKYNSGFIICKGENPSSIQIIYHDNGVLKKENHQLTAMAGTMHMDDKTTKLISKLADEHAKALANPSHVAKPKHRACMFDASQVKEQLKQQEQGEKEHVSPIISPKGR